MKAVSQLVLRIKCFFFLCVSSWFYNKESFVVLENTCSVTINSASPAKVWVSERIPQLHCHSPEVKRRLSTYVNWSGCLLLVFSKQTQAFSCRLSGCVDHVDSWDKDHTQKNSAVDSSVFSQQTHTQDSYTFTSNLRYCNTTPTNFQSPQNKSTGLTWWRRRRTLVNRWQAQRSAWVQDNFTTYWLKCLWKTSQLLSTCKKDTTVSPSWSKSPSIDRRHDAACMQRRHLIDWTQEKLKLKFRRGSPGSIFAGGGHFELPHARALQAAAAELKEPDKVQATVEASSA